MLREAEHELPPMRTISRESCSPRRFAADQPVQAFPPDRPDHSLTDFIRFGLRGGLFSAHKPSHWTESSSSGGDDAVAIMEQVVISSPLTTASRMPLNADVQKTFERIEETFSRELRRSTMRGWVSSRRKTPSETDGPTDLIALRERALQHP